MSSILMTRRKRQAKYPRAKPFTTSVPRWRPFRASTPNHRVWMAQKPLRIGYLRNLYPAGHRRESPSQPLRVRLRDAHSCIPGNAEGRQAKSGAQQRSRLTSPGASIPKTFCSCMDRSRPLPACFHSKITPHLMRFISFHCRHHFQIQRRGKSCAVLSPESPNSCGASDPAHRRCEYRGRQARGDRDGKSALASQANRARSDRKLSAHRVPPVDGGWLAP